MAKTDHAIINEHGKGLCGRVLQTPSPRRKEGHRWPLHANPPPYVGGYVDHRAERLLRFRGGIPWAGGSRIRWQPDSVV